MLHREGGGRDRLSGDVRYIEEVRKRVGEYVGSGKSVQESVSGVKLDDCMPKERTKILSDRFGFLLWCHPENVKRIFIELAASNA